MKRNPTLRAFARGDVGSEKVKAFILDKLIEQAKPSYNENEGQCRYHTDDGLKCAIGHILTDKDYKSKFEGDNASIVCDKLKLKISQNKLHFLDKLQNAHDTLYDYEGDCFKHKLKKSFSNIHLEKEC